MIEEIPLERLGSSEVATMTTALFASDLPASRDIVDVIRDRSDGIPLHVEELLALIVATDGRPGELGADLMRWEAVPDTVEDAIVARLETRSPAAVSLAQAGAVIGRSFDLDLLAAVMDRPLDDLSDAISELGDHFILLPARMPGRYGFRHALICDSIYARLSEPERRRLHSRTADAAQGRTDIGGLPFLALHLEKAGRPSPPRGSAARRRWRCSPLGSPVTCSRPPFAPHHPTSRRWNEVRSRKPWPVPRPRRTTTPLPTSPSRPPDRTIWPVATPSRRPPCWHRMSRCDTSSATTWAAGRLGCPPGWTS
jgi:hypothetical protein